MLANPRRKTLSVWKSDAVCALWCTLRSGTRCSLLCQCAWCFRLLKLSFAMEYCIVSEHQLSLRPPSQSKRSTDHCSAFCLACKQLICFLHLPESCQALSFKFLLTPCFSFLFLFLFFFSHRKEYINL
jgi:hypothetical protein